MTAAIYSLCGSVAAIRIDRLCLKQYTPYVVVLQLSVLTGCAWCNILRELYVLQLSVLTDCDWCNILRELCVLQLSVLTDCDWCNIVRELCVLQLSVLTDCDWCNNSPHAVGVIAIRIHRLPGKLIGKIAGLVIEMLWVRIPAVEAGEFSSPVNFVCYVSFPLPRYCSGT